MSASYGNCQCLVWDRTNARYKRNDIREFVPNRNINLKGSCTRLRVVYNSAMEYPSEQRVHGWTELSTPKES